MSTWSRLAPLILTVHLLLLGAAAAGAHQDEGVIKVLAVALDDTGHGDYEVTLHYGSDGRPAIDATVTVAGDGPDGMVLSPVTLGPADTPGTYRGRVEFPAAGAWTVRISSVEPAAQLDRAEVIESSGPQQSVPDRSSGVAWMVGIVATFVVATGTLAVWSAHRRGAA